MANPEQRVSQGGGLWGKPLVRMGLGPRDGHKKRPLEREP
jgi:hypothetical protein